MATAFLEQSNLTMIDRLGEMKAQIADMTKQADELAAAVKAKGAGTHEGALFNATVTVVDERSVADPKAIEAKLAELMGKQAFEAFCKANQKRVAGYTALKLTSRN